MFSPLNIFSNILPFLKDVLYYRSLKRSLSFLCSTSPEASINAEVHFDLSIDKILPFVCRKFGVLPRDVSSLETDRDSAGGLNQNIMQLVTTSNSFINI